MLAVDDIQPMFSLKAEAPRSQTAAKRLRPRQGRLNAANWRRDLRPMGRENGRQPCSRPVDKRQLLFQQGLPSSAECQVPREGIDPLGYAFGALAIFHGLQSERGAVRHPFHGRTQCRGFPFDFHLNELEKPSQATEPPFVDILAERVLECGQRHLAAHLSRRRPSRTHLIEYKTPLPGRDILSAIGGHAPIG